jgi:broad specificity phosphatase PhoE
MHARCSSSAGVSTKTRSRGIRRLRVRAEGCRVPLSRVRFLVASGSVLLVGRPSAAFGAERPPRKIMLIRHADKPSGDAGGIASDGTDNNKSLQIVGWERAGALARFFASPTAPGIATPTAIFASGLTKDDDGALRSKSARPFETVTPLSALLGIPVDATYTTGDEVPLVNAILRLGGVVLVSWGHKHIAAIARAIPSLDPRAIPNTWPGSRFDMVYVFDLQPGGSRYAFSQVPEMLLAGDSSERIPAAAK